MEVNKIYVGDWVEVAETFPSGIAHLIITSPPYWGQRNYGVDGQLGLEKTPEKHIEKLVLGFRELRRVLRDDGVVFLNYGDKYANTPLGNFTGGSTIFEGRDLKGYIQSGSINSIKASGLKQGDLIGLAWRLALALQADGWYLRSDIIWAKALSFCEKYSGSTMPESINGWRWERHKVKVKKQKKRESNPHPLPHYSGAIADHNPELLAQWKPCPGCPKCAPDGLILRKGSWRPTRAHEYLFQLTKTSSYYCDMEAVREDISEVTIHRDKYTRILENDGPQAIRHDHETISNPSGRNLRDVFCINPQSYKDSHYATFPEKLVEPCIKVGTSEKGCCPKCGAQWARIIEVGYEFRSKGPAGKTDGGTSLETSKARKKGGIHEWPIAASRNTTLGWLPTCKHKEEPVPAVVLDPFCGTATVCAVAAKLGRNYIGIELNPDYVKNQAEYRVAEGETGISKEEQKAGQLALFKGKDCKDGKLDGC